MPKKTLMNFPCDFSLKVIGVSSPSFFEDIQSIVSKYYTVDADKISQNLSQYGQYMAITLVIHVTSQPPLDALYQELNQHKHVKMVL